MYIYVCRYTYENISVVNVFYNRSKFVSFFLFVLIKLARNVFFMFFVRPPQASPCSKLLRGRKNNQKDEIRERPEVVCALEERSACWGWPPGGENAEAGWALVPLWPPGPRPWTGETSGHTGPP